MKKLLTILLTSVSLLSSAYAEEAIKQVLIINAKIFDGTNTLVEGKDVLIQGNKIAQIAEGIMITQDTNSLCGSAINERICLENRVTHFGIRCGLDCS